MKSLIIAGLTLLVAANPATARELAVPDIYSTIKRALAIAEPGDVIQLRRGQYTEYDLHLRSDVAIQGIPDDPAACIIDGGGRGRVFLAEGVDQVRLSDLTITGGHARGSFSYTASGGGLFANDASILLEDVYLVNNRSESSGGGVRATNTAIDLVGCEFAANSAARGGGAIDVSVDSQAEAIDCRFDGNRAAWGGAVSVRASSWCRFEQSDFRGNQALPPLELGGAFFADRSALVVFQSCVLAGNSARQGGAVRVADANCGFVNCTVDGNDAWEQGAGFMVRSGRIAIDHSIISYNLGDAVVAAGGTVWIGASDVHGNEGQNWHGPLADFRDRCGNFAADPGFCDLEEYGISQGSPCAPQNNEYGQIGARSVGCDEAAPMLERLATRNPGGTSRPEGPEVAAGEVSIASVRPNPFNPRVTITFATPMESDVCATIYDATGRLVRTLHHGVLPPGNHVVSWDSLDDQGRPRATGMYLLRLDAGRDTVIRKLLLIK